MFEALPKGRGIFLELYFRYFKYGKDEVKTFIITQRSLPKINLLWISIVQMKRFAENH